MIERHECDERALKIARQHEPDDGHMCAQLQCKIIDAMQWASAASPAPSQPEDVEASAAFLNEAARYFENCPAKGEDRAFWATVHNAENCRKTAALIQSLSSQLAEARAEIAEKSGSWVLSRCVEAEANRDRIAAENERLRAPVGGPVPTDECEFRIGQPVRLAEPYAGDDPNLVYFVTGIRWEHRPVPARGWDITIATAEELAKGHGQTDGFAPSDLRAALASLEERT